MRLLEQAGESADSSPPPQALFLACILDIMFKRREYKSLNWTDSSLGGALDLEAFVPDDPKYRRTPETLGRDRMILGLIEADEDDFVSQVAIPASPFRAETRLAILGVSEPVGYDTLQSMATLGADFAGAETIWKGLAEVVCDLYPDGNIMNIAGKHLVGSYECNGTTMENHLKHLDRRVKKLAEATV